MQPAYIGCGAAFIKKMKTRFLLFLAERTQWIVNPPHYSKMSIEGIMSVRRYTSVLRSRRFEGYFSDILYCCFIE